MLWLLPLLSRFLEQPRTSVCYRFKSFFFRLFALTLTGLSCIPFAQAEERYSLEQIFAERQELDKASAIDAAKTIELIDERLAKTNNNQIRQAALYLEKARIKMHLGLAPLEENLGKALALIKPELQPELYLYAMVMKSYGMYTYQNQAEQAAVLLDSLQQHPALINDAQTHLMFLTNQLEVYYKLKQFHKISKPLFKLAEVMNSGSMEQFKELYLDLEAELAYHSGAIGDTGQALALYNKTIRRAQQRGMNETIAISYCNMANIYFLPLEEKIRYAKASLAAHTNVACSDVMDKLVLLGEVQQGNLANIARLVQFNTTQQMPRLNERSAYYAGLAYLQLNDLPSAKAMLNRITDPDNWERYDLLQQIRKVEGNYQAAFEASQRYQQLRAQKDAEARSLMLSSYQVRLEMAQEETQAAEKAKQAEQLAAAEQKATSRLYMMLTIIGSGVLVTLVLSLYLYRSFRLGQKLQQLSDTDPLTGLLNRRAFIQRAMQLHQLAHRQRFPLSIALLDLDFFKQINDKHGHQAGDAVLAAFANAAKATLRQTDIIGRFGGEEFILATTEQDTLTIAALLQRLQHSFTQHCSENIQLGVEVSFSAGIASVNAQDTTRHQDIEDAIRRADEQLYRAKANGRQQACTETLCLTLV